MKKELYALTIEGNNKTWSFHVEGTEEYQRQWRADGLEVDKIMNIIPEWIVDFGLLKPFCWIQNLFCGK